MLAGDRELQDGSRSQGRHEFSLFIWQLAGDFRDVPFFVQPFDPGRQPAGGYPAQGRVVDLGRRLWGVPFRHLVPIWAAKVDLGFHIIGAAGLGCFAQQLQDVG